MDNISAKPKATHRFGKGVRKGQRIPKLIKKGTSRKSKSRKLQCSKCGAYFATLKELNLHYTANPQSHKRAKAKPKAIVVKEFHEFSPEQQKIAVAFANMVYNKNEMRKQIIKKIREKFGGVESRRW